MKKIHVPAMIVMALAGLVAGCSSDSSSSDFNLDDVRNVFYGSAHDAFKNAFVAEFGQPYADQDWGFGDAEAARTRAASTNAEIVALGAGIVNLSVDDLKESGFKRIIAEDLSVSQNSDFDYNDIVFDAKRVIDAGSGDYATFYLIVRATGAWKKIYVGDDDAEGAFEVHELFGAGDSTFVNTTGKTRAKDNGAYWSTDHEPVFVALKVKKTGSAEPSLIDIPIRVDGNALALTAHRGQPAEKLCVDCDYSWVTEKEKMKTWYPTFQHYVTGDEMETSWWHNTYWDGNTVTPNYTIVVGGKTYALEFEQSGVAEGSKRFYTTRPIKIYAFEIGSDGSKTLLPLGGNNKIKVLCNGDHGHFSRSISYNSDHTATLVTPDDEINIYHAPVTITLIVGNASASARSDINIWPKY